MAPCVFCVIRCVAPIKVLGSHTSKMPVAATVQGQVLSLWRELVNMEAHRSMRFHRLEIITDHAARLIDRPKWIEQTGIALICRKHLDPVSAATAFHLARFMCRPPQKHGVWMLRRQTPLRRVDIRKVLFSQCAQHIIHFPCPSQDRKKVLSSESQRAIFRLFREAVSIFAGGQTGQSHVTSNHLTRILVSVAEWVKMFRRRYEQVVPAHGFETRYPRPKPGVLPLDEAGMALVAPLPIAIADVLQRHASDRFVPSLNRWHDDDALTHMTNAGSWN